MTTSKDILLNEDATASAVFAATKKLIGDTFLVWEPESIWLELESHGINLGHINRDKLQAVITLITTGSFYWDAAVFENTAIAFDSLPVEPEGLQEASPAQLAWAVLEADWLHKDGGVFDYEPAQYAAVSMYRAGMVLAPEPLSFAQPSLDSMNFETLELRDEVAKRWAELDKDKLPREEFQETPVDVQLAHLSSIYIFIQDKAKQLKEEMLSFPYPP
jgi:hypothetical protein